MIPMDSDMTLVEKVSFLKGLIEGSELKLDPKQEKILSLMMDILQDVSRSVADLEEGMDDLSDDVDLLSDESEEIIGTVKKLGDFLDKAARGLAEAAEEDDDTENYYEIECERCGNVISVEEDTIFEENELTCPNCGETIEIDFTRVFEEPEEKKHRTLEIASRKEPETDRQKKPEKPDKPGKKK